MVLSDDEIAGRLESLKGWRLHGNEITKTFTLKDFTAAMAFVTAVSLLSERANHHPDIDIRYNRVTLVLSTHSAGGLTEKDFTLAGKIEGIA